MTNRITLRTLKEKHQNSQGVQGGQGDGDPYSNDNTVKSTPEHRRMPNPRIAEEETSSDDSVKSPTDPEIEKDKSLVTARVKKKGEPVPTNHVGTDLYETS